MTELVPRRGAKRDIIDRRLKGDQKRFKYDRTAVRDEDDAEDQNDGGQA